MGGRRLALRVGLCIVSVAGQPIPLLPLVGDPADDADDQVKLAFRGLHLSDIHIEQSDRIALERCRFGLSPWTSGGGRYRAAGGSAVALTGVDEDRRL